MAFYKHENVFVKLNNQNIYCNSLSLNQETNLEHPYQVGELVNLRNVPSSPVKSNLSLNYYLTGTDYLKDYIFTDYSRPLTGNIAGILFNQGYLESYSLNAQPNSPLEIRANLIICDEISGIFTPFSPSLLSSDIIPWNFNDVTITKNNNYSAFNPEYIVSYNWNFKSQIDPIYYYKQTGEKHINPDRIIVGEKEISVDIVTNNTSNLSLPFTGENFAIDLVCHHPSISTITETYSVSGKINKKDLSVSINDFIQPVYSITQSHINEEPKINSIDISTYPANNYILINSPNLNNGYYTTNNNFSLVKKVILGDRDLNFTTNRGITFDTITGYISTDSINGSLQIQTTKGLIVYPSGLILNFSGIGVSGFIPETGYYKDIIKISGTNFYRITDVRFGGVSTNFKIKQNTGTFHEIVATIPNNAPPGNIQILSSLKNVSGSSTGIFYTMPEITGFYPQTGMWSGIITIGGTNFSGITNLYFNNIKSPSFKVLSNTQITGAIPGTGAGYTKGYIKISGHRGLEVLSHSIYQPIVPIYSISALSGTIAEDLVINTIFDSGFLYPIYSPTNSHLGYKVAFGNTTGTFVRSGVSPNLMTGLIPSEFFGNGYVTFYQPDGITKYPPYTGKFLQIGPAPVIDSMYPEIIYQYQTYTINLEGQNFKDFFGMPYYALISGEKDTYIYPNIYHNDLYNKVQISGVKITGEIGYYDVYLNNYVGSGKITGLKLNTGINIARTQGINVQQSPNVSYRGSSHHRAIMALDGHVENYSSTSSFSAPDSGWWSVTFGDGPHDISLVKISQPVDLIFTVLEQGSLVMTGFMQFFDNGLEISYTSGVTEGWTGFYGRGINLIANPSTGVRVVKFYNYPDNATNKALAFGEIEIY